MDACGMIVACLRAVSLDRFEGSVDRRGDQRGTAWTFPHFAAVFNIANPGSGPYYRKGRF
jgi:hypothetical protein